MKNVISLIAVAGVAGVAGADIIAQWGTAGSTDSIAPSIETGVSADNLQAGTGIDFLNFSTFNFNNWDDTNTSAADAIADDEIWTWGFDVTGAGIDLTDFDIRIDRSGSGPDDFNITYSVNGGAAVEVLNFDFGDTSAGVDFVGVDLSSVPTLNTGDSIVFTLAAWNAESTGGTFDLETVDFNGQDPRALRINGRVIPAPGAMALLGLGGLAAARRRRA